MEIKEVEADGGGPRSPTPYWLAVLSLSLDVLWISLLLQTFLVP